MEQILKTEYLKQPFNAVMHCFSSGQSLANTAIELGFYVSMSGIITFPKSHDLRNIFSKIPLDKILVATLLPNFLTKFMNLALSTKSTPIPLIIV